MNNSKLKKLKILAIIGIFLLSFLAHFMYNFFPNILTSFFFPVNESIFEHMKILYTSTLIYGLIDYSLLKLNKIKFANFKAGLFLTSFLSIPIYLIIYLPLYAILGENLIISISLLLITYIISQLLSYYLLSAPNLPLLNKLAIPLIILVYLNFIFLTYAPPHNFLFLDTTTNSYGISKKYVAN